MYQYNKEQKCEHTDSCFYNNRLIKGILRVSGKRRVDLYIRVFRPGQEDREFLVYANSIKNFKKYLSKKYANHAKVNLYLKNSKEILLHSFKFYQTLPSSNF